MAIVRMIRVVSVLPASVAPNARIERARWQIISVWITARVLKTCWRMRNDVSVCHNMLVLYVRSPFASTTVTTMVYVVSIRPVSRRALVLIGFLVHSVSSIIARARRTAVVHETNAIWVEKIQFASVRAMNDAMQVFARPMESVSTQTMNYRASKPRVWMCVLVLSSSLLFTFAFQVAKLAFPVQDAKQMTARDIASTMARVWLMGKLLSNASNITY